MRFVLVGRADRMRGPVEDAICRIYRDRYEALLPSFPDLLIAGIDRTGKIECAAGLRSSEGVLFAEHYLDRPVELLLGVKTGQAVQREGIVEVCHLVAPKPGCSLDFVWRLIEFVDTAGTRWAIFTATRSLRVLLGRAGLKMIELAHAQAGRIPDPADWGSYFKHDPRVMAVSSAMAFSYKPRLRLPSGEPGLSAYA